MGYMEGAITYECDPLAIKVQAFAVPHAFPANFYLVRADVCA